MRKIIVIALLLANPICFLFGQTSSTENYIKFTYGGPSADRYIADVFFSNKPISPELYISGLFFKMKNKDFAAIKKVIENSKDITQIDTVKGGYYKILISSDSKKMLYKAINPEKVNLVFNEITKQISKPSLRRKVSETLALIYKDMLNPY